MPTISEVRSDIMKEAAKQWPGKVRAFLDVVDATMWTHVSPMTVADDTFNEIEEALRDLRSCHDNFYGKL